MKTINYPFILRQLTQEEGTGFLIEFPDLSGCMSDGETIEEAIYNGSSTAFVLAANRMLYRLTFLYPEKYSFLSYNSRKKYITDRISQRIKEKTNDKDKP